MTSVVLVHGYNSGPHIWAGIEPHLRALHDVSHFDYSGDCNGPLTGLAGAWARNKRRAGQLAARAHYAEVGIGHSNGCTLLWRAAMRYGVFKRLILIHAALAGDITFPDHLERVYVFHDDGDLPVRLAARLPRWIRRQWGQMGALGYSGRADSRVVNWRYDDDYGVGIAEHSELLTGPMANVWGPRLARDFVTGHAKKC